MSIKILVVDEAAFVRDSIKRALRSFLSSAEVHDAVNGNRALPILRTNKIDIILSDWELPEMSGAELLAWVRNDEKYQKVPFIVVSSSGDKNVVLNAIEAGANDFVAKPFSPDELQRKVIKQLHRIGFKIRQKNTSQSSLEALTGTTRKAQPIKPREIKSAAEFLGGANPRRTAAPADKSGSFQGAARLVVGNLQCQCEITEMSLTAINMVTERPDPIPTVFDKAVVAITNNDNEPIANLNVYVHAVQSTHPRPDSGQIKLNVRFVDNDPEQFEMLSKAIARGR